MGSYINFEELKNRIGIKDIVMGYGFKVDRSGMLCCPFHNDKDPSMKIYETQNIVHCFGCGVHADSIAFVQKLFNLEPLDAALKINQDFGLRLSTDITKSAKEIAQVHSEILQRKERNEFQEKIVHSIDRNMSTYIRTLNSYKANFAPKSPYDVLNPRYLEALQHLEEAIYVSSRFSDCHTTAEKLVLLNEFSEYIAFVNSRVAQIEKSEKGIAYKSVQKKINANVRKIKSADVSKDFSLHKTNNKLCDKPVR